jgi:SOS-response transcriptional repressor LexA
MHETTKRLYIAAEKMAKITGQSALARLLNESPQTLKNWEARGVSKAGIIKAVEKIGCSTTWLSSGTGSMQQAHNNVEQGPGTRGMVPLISWVQAGAWCEVVDVAEVREPAPDYHDSSTYLPCPAPHSPSTFALRVKGDSMTAPYGRSYPDGCFIYVDPERRSPKNGDRIVACLEGSDDEVTFKIYKNEDGRQWLLPLNPQHPPLFERFKVIGTVLGKWEDG